VFLFSGYQEFDHYSGSNAYPYPPGTYNYADHPPTTPSPSESPTQHGLAHDYLRKPMYPQPYDELDTGILPPSDHYRITPSPGVSIPHDLYGKFVTRYSFAQDYV